MKTIFKPMALAAAVAAVAAGYTGVTQAQIANNGLGDAAVIPYFTVAEDFVTGVHIINTSDLRFPATVPTWSKTSSTVRLMASSVR